MQKIILSIISALLLITLAKTDTHAQNTEKKEGEKTTTIDAWRQALPDNNQSSDTPPAVVMEESKDNVEGEETPEQIEKRILDLERRLMEALKLRDRAVLRRFLADDFVLAGVNTAANATGTGTNAAQSSDKTRYIEWALRNLELKTYNLEKAVVRVFPSTVVVTFNYKRQASVAGSPADGDFTVTDVWVKRGKRWQAVAHHISPLSKP